MFSRSSIIEGLIRSRFQHLTENQFLRFYAMMNRMSNDDIAADYHKTTGTYIRQITSSTFIALN